MDLRALVRAIIRQTVAFDGVGQIHPRALIADAVLQVRGERHLRGGTPLEAALRILHEDTQAYGVESV